jgi:hypothetical protein
MAESMSMFISGRRKPVICLGNFCKGIMECKNCLIDAYLTALELRGD